MCALLCTALPHPPVASWTDNALVLYMTRGLKHCLAKLVSNRDDRTMSFEGYV